MPESTESAPPSRFGIFRRKRPTSAVASAAAWDALQKNELDASLAVLRRRQREERRNRRVKLLVGYWPIALGVVLGAMAPVLHATAALFGYWGTALVFPYVVLAGRPEIQVGPITHILPTIMLYAQFPIEGWLARFILSRHVKFSSVVAQVLLFHFLGVAWLLLLSSAAGGFLRR